MNKLIDYSTVKPLGIPASIKILEFQPQSSYGNISYNDTIRFQINTPGFWDPYSAFINIEVDFSDMDENVFQQLDGSAHSFISELIIYNKGTEIERIQEYDGVANILSDMGYDPNKRMMRRHEGYGGATKETLDSYSSFRGSRVTNANGLAGQYRSTVGAHPFQANYVDNPSGQVTDAYTKYQFSEDTATLVNAKAYGSVTPIFEKLEAAQLQGGTISVATVERNYFAFERADQNLVNVNGQSLQEGYSAAPINSKDNPHPHNVGYRSLYNHDFSNGAFEPRFSKTYPQNITSSGRMGQSKLVQTASFSIPILSGMMGILMPRESYKYIPMSALEDLILEFRMNRAAVFTSGYNNDVWTAGGASFSAASPFTKALTGTTKRTWKLTKFEIVADIIQFDKEIEDGIKAKLNSEGGIVLHTNSWYLGPQYQVNGTQAANGTWQVNLGFESLKGVVFYFLLDDWKTYPFCRKHFRVSRNLTWMQLKIGINYYPSQPIEGNSGDSKKWQNNTANNEFLLNLYKTFNQLNDAESTAFINAENFAVNERPYDVTDTRAYYVPGQGILNTNTAAGLPGFYENQVVGKALYGINLESLNNDFTQISGVNTIVNKPFEITLRTDPSTVLSALDKASTLYVFCYYDFLIQLHSSGVRVLGRG